jgi:DNA-binding CsgD family transcriptional regulator
MTHRNHALPFSGLILAGLGSDAGLRQKYVERFHKMPSSFLLLTGLALVSVVAAVKLALFGFAFGGFSLFGAAAIYAALWLATAAVAYGIYLLATRTLEDRRRQQVLAKTNDNPGKENIIAAHAAEWGLTKAETDVALMVVKGFSNAEIAAMRNSALQTVKSQLSAIYAKSGLEGRYQLIAYITDEVCETSKISQQAANHVEDDKQVAA